MRILIDAVNVTAAGPLAVASSLIPRLLDRESLRCHGLVPAGPLAALDWREPTRVVHARRPGWTNRAQRIVDAVSRVPSTARRFDVEVTLTLGDIGSVRGTIPTVLFVHNALLLGSDRGLVARAQRLVFSRAVDRAACVIVQSPVMAEALRQMHGVDDSRVRIVAHPSPTIAGLGRVPLALRAPATGDSISLLYLAAYYPHKRHDLLPGIARALRDAGRARDIRIYITLPETDQTAALLSSLQAEAGALVTNLGRLTQEDAAAALSAVDGILHLSDAESYGMTLYEAMKAGKRVIAPDLAYATWACGDAATYFRPGSPEAAATAILDALASRDAQDRHAIGRAEALHKFLPTWDAVGDEFVQAMRQAAGA